ncbi:MAG: OmpA family protein [Gammaproteobacteria bacterium]|jgi:outer membrane protein OmpA-like peptidoglycan-associated protein
MHPVTAHAAAAVALTLLSGVPGLTMAQDLEGGSRFVAPSSVLSQVSMFTYQEGRKSDLILRAAPVLSGGEGKIEVEFEDGTASIDAEVRRMPAPGTLGPYTAYVLWALTPDGRASNIGVVAGMDDDKGELETQHAASQFSLIVTAEPHFAVSTPSSAVVMYNVADKVRGIETKIASQFEHADYSNLSPIERDGRPVELIQAEYSVTIAHAADADVYVPTELQAAQAKLDAARTAWASSRNRDRKSTPDIAREAVIAAEAARRAALVAGVAAQEEAQRRAAAQAARDAERERAAAARAEAANAAALEAETRARAEARAELMNRLSAVLPTRETDRGLVSEISGVQFATGTANINQAARERLARFSGIVASYPELDLRIEGHTDNVGTDAANTELSLRRAIRVREYLVSLGVPLSSIEVDGFGESRPVADNDTVAGRARNRRVEIVISGGLLVAGNR